VSFYHVPVKRRLAARPEVEEAISAVKLASPEKVWSEVKSGSIRDSFTIQGLALYERLNPAP